MSRSSSGKRGRPSAADPLSGAPRLNRSRPNLSRPNRRGGLRRRVTKARVEGRFAAAQQDVLVRLNRNRKRPSKLKTSKPRDALVGGLLEAPIVQGRQERRGREQESRDRPPKTDPRGLRMVRSSAVSLRQPPSRLSTWDSKYEFRAGVSNFHIGGIGTARFKEAPRDDKGRGIERRLVLLSR